MKRVVFLLCVAAFATAVSAQVAPEKASKTAQTLLDHLDAGRFNQAEALFAETMKAAVPEPKLKAVWTSMAPAGKRGDFKVNLRDAVRVVVIPMQRGAQAWVATIVVDEAGKVSGLFIQPAQQIAPVPEVSASADFTEREWKVGSGADALPATLAMPKGKGPFPAVLLVHGSGAQDRNETIGANRPFMDIARALASQGIAVLRYDKRSKAMPEWYLKHPVTIDNETTDDAVLALATLRSQPGIDSNSIFVLGHSQGAMLAPRIASKDGRVAGIIEWSGPARKLVEVLPEQIRFLGKAGNAPDAQTEASLAELQAAIEKYRDPNFNGPSLMGQTASYWRSVDTVDPLKDTLQSRLPVLILHGGRDFQVTDTDWQIWQRNLKGNKRATLKRYPALNHLGIAGTGEPDMSECSKPGHVDPALIEDVVNWIKVH